MQAREVQQLIMRTDFTDPANLLTPLKAIRWKCIDCTCGQQVEIRECPIKTCPLWPYRLGHRPGADIESGAREASVAAEPAAESCG